MAEAAELLLKLVGTPRALSEMEQDMQTFLSSVRMHGTVQLTVPPEIYTPLHSAFLESEVFHKKSYPIGVGGLQLGTVTIWSYRPLEPAQIQEIESYLFPWLLAFRHRLMSVVGHGNLFGRWQFSATEVDFYKRRIWYEIERGKRYNVFLTYFRIGMKLSADIHEERIAEGFRRILRPFEPSICFLESSRVDFMKIGQAAAAAERFVPDIHEALRHISCEAKEIKQLTFPKDFFEFEECIEKIAL